LHAEEKLIDHKESDADR